jgi:hypothetical protein
MIDPSLPCVELELDDQVMLADAMREDRHRCQRYTWYVLQGSAMKSGRVESLWKKIKQQLEKERHRIYDEIRNYPAPIPACDAQFNHLLEERRRISQELLELEQLSSQNLTPEQHVKSIATFITSSTFINDETDPEIASCLEGSPFRAE